MLCFYRKIQPIACVLCTLCLLSPVEILAKIPSSNTAKKSLQKITSQNSRTGRRAPSSIKKVSARSFRKNKKNQIQINIDRNSVSSYEKFKEENAKTQLIDIFDSSLFDTPPTYLKPLPNWLHDSDLIEKRSQIIGSQSGTFEGWWKMAIDGFSFQSQSTDGEQMIRAKLNAKILTQLTNSLFARAEFELLTGSGSIQKIYKKLEAFDKIYHKEIAFLWTASDWLTMHFGAINQRFLGAPLLMADIPFPSLLEEIHLSAPDKHELHLNFQQAITNTFSDDNSYNTQKLTKTPLFLTHSIFWTYDPKTFYKVKMRGTFFHFSNLTRDIAINAMLYGNTISGSPGDFKHKYYGAYLALEPSFQIFSNLGLQLKIHHIDNWNIPNEDNFSQGELYSLSVPFDVTENLRITTTLEYFVNQSDSSVGYYSSETYGHNNRQGYLGNITFDLYNKNMAIGLGVLRSYPVRKDSISKNQTYFLLFLRTNYAKI